MLKRLMTLPAVIVLAMGLVACGTESGGEAESADASSAETPTEAPTDEPAAEPSEGAAPGGACEYVADSAPAKEADLPPSEPADSGEVSVTMETSEGEIGLTLDASATPCTVNSFTSLARQSYFDDTTCHRLTGGGGLSVLQCGDPSATGAGGPGYSFADELTGDETYPAGTLAMANAGPNTNGSQFFMVYEDSQLPPAYTVFGTFDDAGLKVLREVAADGSNEQNGPGDGAPNTPVDIESVTVN